MKMDRITSILLCMIMELRVMLKLIQLTGKSNTVERADEFISDPEDIGFSQKMAKVDLLQHMYSSVDSYPGGEDNLEAYIISLREEEESNFQSATIEETTTAIEDTESTCFGLPYEGLLDNLMFMEGDGLCDTQTEIVREKRAERQREQTRGGLSGWVYASPFIPLSVAVDDADLFLESRFHKEVNGILGNVNAELKSDTTRKRCEPPKECIYSPLDVFDIFLPPNILHKLCSYINRSLVSRRKQKVTDSEIRGIIILHVLCASYSESPNTICSSNEEGCFLQLGISAKRYYDIWSALSGTFVKRTRIEYADTTWEHQPGRENRFITEIEQEIAAINRNLLYIPHCIVLSLDDDHLRLSSRSVSELTNLSQVNNPAKALGPVMNGLCSALTSAFLVGHLSRPGESLIDVWVRIAQHLQGVPTSGALHAMPDAIFAADRGYNSKATIAFITNELNATALGTHKRSLDYPFCFGDGPQ